MGMFSVRAATCFFVASHLCYEPSARIAGYVSGGGGDYGNNHFSHDSLFAIRKKMTPRIAVAPMRRLNERGSFASTLATKSFLMKATRASSRIELALPRVSLWYPNINGFPFRLNRVTNSLRID